MSIGMIILLALGIIAVTIITLFIIVAVSQVAENRVDKANKKYVEMADFTDLKAKVEGLLSKDE